MKAREKMCRKMSLALLIVLSGCGEMAEVVPTLSVQNAAKPINQVRQEIRVALAKWVRPTNKIELTHVFSLNGYYAFTGSRIGQYDLVYREYAFHGKFNPQLNSIDEFDENFIRSWPVP